MRFLIEVLADWVLGGDWVLGSASVSSGGGAIVATFLVVHTHALVSRESISIKYIMEEMAITQTISGLSMVAGQSVSIESKWRRKESASQ